MLKLFSVVMAILMYIILTSCSSVLVNHAFSPLLLNVEFLGKQGEACTACGIGTGVLIFSLSRHSSVSALIYILLSRLSEITIII